MSGALLVAGTASDAGKTAVVAGLCRALARRGVKVAPFKAQNMALNSAVTADGAEIGRAQAMQAAAAGVAPEAAMNPILLKPTGEATSQVVVMGQPDGHADARGYQDRKTALLPVVLDALADLRSRYDAVICEGAGSPAEINLREADLVNMGLARAADIPTIVVGDIDRGGVFAALYGTLALLDAADQALIAGFVINKFRGDPGLLTPGLDRLRALTGRPVLGVLPWTPGLWLDAEDSLALDSLALGARDAQHPAPPTTAHAPLDVAVVRLPRISNFTDADALSCEPGVRVTFTTIPADIARADLVILPGTKATIADLDWLHTTGLAAAITARAATRAPILGICGGYQMLGLHIIDAVEAAAPADVAGLGLLPVTTRFQATKVLARPHGTSPHFGGAAVSGYEIRHGRVTAHASATPLLRTATNDEGCVAGNVLATSWHGLLECDDFRRQLLTWVAQANGRDFTAADTAFADVREARLDTLGDLVADHLDMGAIDRLLADGAPPGLGVIGPASAPPPSAPPAKVGTP